jgi:hypothetical protein
MNIRTHTPPPHLLAITAIMLAAVLAAAALPGEPPAPPAGASAPAARLQQHTTPFPPTLSDNWELFLPLLIVPDASEPAPPAPPPLFALVGQLAQPVQALDPRGDYLYLASGSDMVVVDMLKPATPTIIASLPMGATIFDIALSPEFAYLATESFAIVRITSPTIPVLEATAETPAPITSLAVSGNYAYAITAPFAPGADTVLPSPIDAGAVAPYALRLINTNVLDEVREVGAYDISETGEGVVVAGKYAYVAAGAGGLRMIDISNPIAPQEVGNFMTSAAAVDVAMRGSHVYVVLADGAISVINISDPRDLQQVQFYRHPFRATSIIIEGGVAYIGLREHSLAVLDIDDSVTAAPQLIERGIYPTPGYVNDIATDGDYVYVADAEVGVLVLQHPAAAR